MPDNRVTCRGHSTYRTTRNKWRKVRTPGGNLTTLRIKRRPQVPKCQITGVKLNGIKRELAHKLHHHERTVNRAYGGTMSMKAVRDRIIRAFLTEEAKASQQKGKEQRRK